MTHYRLFVVLFFLLRLAATAQPLQTADGLAYRPIRTIDPTDLDFADLAFLKQEISQARVVFLGEHSHGEGNVFEAKIRLVRFLQSKGLAPLPSKAAFTRWPRRNRTLRPAKVPKLVSLKACFLSGLTAGNSSP